MKDFLYANKLLIIGENLKYYAYDAPEYGINAAKFVEHCLCSKLLDKDFNNLGI